MTLPPDPLTPPGWFRDWPAPPRRRSRRIAVVVLAAAAFLVGILADRAVLAATPRPQPDIPAVRSALPGAVVRVAVEPDQAGTMSPLLRFGAIVPPLLVAQEWALRVLGGHQYGCLDRLISRESGWRVRARNARSGAYGLFQSVPASKYALAGSDWRTNPMTQMRWGLLFYIPSRYGSACAALDHALAVGWY